MKSNIWSEIQAQTNYIVILFTIIYTNVACHCLTWLCFSVKMLSGFKQRSYRTSTGPCSKAVCWGGEWPKYGSQRKQSRTPGCLSQIPANTPTKTWAVCAAAFDEASTGCLCVYLPPRARRRRWPQPGRRRQCKRLRWCLGVSSGTALTYTIQQSCT